MNSVRITCICDGIRISDLGVSLKKGDSIVVSIDKARKSKDLKPVSYTHLTLPTSDLV